METTFPFSIVKSESFNRTSLLLFLEVILIDLISNKLVIYILNLSLFPANIKVYNCYMENLFKNLLTAAFVIVIGSTLIFFYFNHLESVENEINLSSNKLINSESYKDKNKVSSYMNNFKDIKSSSSSYLIPLLSSNYFLENNEPEMALKVLDKIPESDSKLINDLIFSLQSRIYAEINMCDKSINRFEKIDSYNSIASDTRTYIGKCLRESVK